MRTIITARRSAAALVAGLAALALAAAPANARPATAAPAKPNIVETAVAAGNFTTLVSLVKQAGLAETLSGTGPYTVFAPTDAAFKKVPKKTLTALGKDKAKLKAVLLYHVAAGRLAAKRVVKQSSIKTLNGKRVQIRVRGRNVFVNRSKVVTADVRTSNGIHPRRQPRPDPLAAGAGAARISGARHGPTSDRAGQPARARRRSRRPAAAAGPP